jgi:four helix bundle protein
MTIRSHRELKVWQAAMDLAMDVYHLTRTFPADERNGMTDQIRRSSRSVAANLSEAWRKRRYEAAFVAKLSNAEAEAAETQTWLELALRCTYLTADKACHFDAAYEALIAQSVTMISNPAVWVIRKQP